MKFPIGGIVRERISAGLDRGSSQDLVKLQNRQYSLDKRRCVKAVFLAGKGFMVVLRTLTAEFLSGHYQYICYFDT